MQLRHAASTDTGRMRDHNEDTFAIEADPERAEAGALFVVCDGMGGFASGEVASALAASTITANYYTAAPDPRGALRAAFIEANERIWSRGHGRMGTTAIAALFLDDVLLLANVGDSRAYRIRDGTIQQLTRDHSFVEEQVSAGVLTADQARESSYRNVITRALGYRPEVEADLYEETVMAGDRILLCSDGLHGQVEPEEIARLAGSGPLQRAVDALIALANDRGGLDNITAVLVEVAGVETGSGKAPLERTERLRATAAGGSTAKSASVLATAAPAERGATGDAAYQPAQARQAAPPLQAPLPRRGPILGLILMTLLGLALLASMVWFVLTSDAGGLMAAPTPSLPPLTPVHAVTETPGTRATPAPTLVPTMTPGTTSRP